MKLFAIILSLYFAVIVAADDFLDGVKRAEYFEKTDGIVPIFEFTMPEADYNTMKGNVGGSPFSNKEKFRTKDAQLVFKMGDTVKTFPEVTFTVGGFSSKTYSKQAFNFKIRNDELFGRKQFRIRSDAREPTFLRSKIFCDINNRLGQPDSISANYIKMTVNGEDYGFYIIMDSLKMTYVNIEHGDKDSTNLIQCGDLHADLTVKNIGSCESENDENPDMSSFRELVQTLDNANSVAQLEEVLNIDAFMKAVLMDYLSGSWDHFCLYGHNYSMYKPPNGKWEMVLYDFDATFGQDLSSGFMFGTPAGITSGDITTWPNAKFEDWHGNKHVINVILQEKPEIFIKNLQEIITKAFNPKLLFPHIDELKEFIRPYVVEDKTPGPDGSLPGRINSGSRTTDYTLSQWEANSEFTHLAKQSYGFKRWILDKFNFVCTTYDIDCSVASEYLNNQFTYTTTTYIQPTNTGNTGGGMDWGNGGFGGFGGGNNGNNWGNGGNNNGNNNGNNWNNWGNGGNNNGNNNGNNWNNWGNGGNNNGNNNGNNWNNWGNGGNNNGNNNGNNWNNWGNGGNNNGNNNGNNWNNWGNGGNNNGNNNGNNWNNWGNGGNNNGNNNGNNWNNWGGNNGKNNGNNGNIWGGNNGNNNGNNGNNWGNGGNQQIPSATTTTNKAQPAAKPCWSLNLGYPCCVESNPTVYYTDSDGNWGIEKDNWCGIIN